MFNINTQNVEKNFTFQFNNGNGIKAIINAPIVIPNNVSAREFAGRLIKAHKIPNYVEEDLKKSIEDFTDKETKEFYDNLAEEAIAKVQNEADINKLAERWAKAFQEEHSAFAKPEEPSNEAVFSEVYHRMIHSPSMETLLNLEHTYAMSVEELISKRDAALLALTKKHEEEMEQAVLNLTDDDVNNLAISHFEQLQLLESQWASKLSALHETQKREYRQWIMTVHEDYQMNVGSPTTEQRIRAFSATIPALGEEDRTPQISRMEESFTIHLGAQLKTMHNLRLLSADVLDLCRHKLHKIGGMVVPQPQRLQTAMSLYSHNLCGLVLLVDNRPNTYTGIKREFASICQRSTEFHFPDLEQQFEGIRENAIKANEWQAQGKNNEDGEKISTVSSSSSADQNDRQSNLQVGDFYITRHSNLSEVHVVFHMVVDDTLRSADISSRHPCILGLRNVLKTACRHDITTVTIPLLLVHEMSEEMTIPWCLRRAELLFKCIKGFMMEMASWGGNESQTVQFLVPKGISESLFSQLCTMLPSIFRISTPLVLKSSS